MKNLLINSIKSFYLKMFLNSIIYFGIFSQIIFVLPSPDEARLHRDIMNGYVVEERPVIDPATPVKVRITVILQQIIDLNEKEETLTVNAWLNFLWQDTNLRWDPLQYGGVQDLRHPYGTIWNPDIILYNSVDSSIDSTFKVNLISYYDGNITWIPPGIFKISCKFNIYWYPFDEQICFFKFGSWSFHGGQLDLIEGDFDLSEYMLNGEWIIIKSWVKKTVKQYDCCEEKYPDLQFYIHLRRRTLYYAFNLLMPCALVMLLVMLGFTLSPNTCEKIGLQISVSLAVTIFLSMLSEVTPQTSEAVPLLGVFFESCLIICILATSFTVYVQSLHFRNQDSHKRMGFWMRYILLEWVPYLLFIKHPRRENNMKTLKKTWTERKKYETDIRTAFVYNDDTCRVMTTLGTVLEENFDHVIMNIKQVSNEDDQQLINQLKTLDSIYKHVKIIRQNNDDEVEGSRIRYEWQFAAMVVDRLGLIICTIVTLGTALTILLRAPYLVA